LCTVKKTPDDGQKNCPKHVEFYSKNKFEKLVHLVGFIIRIYAILIQNVSGWGASSTANGSGILHNVALTVTSEVQTQNVF